MLRQKLSTPSDQVPLLFQMMEIFVNQFGINTMTPSGTTVSYLTEVTGHIRVMMIQRTEWINLTQTTCLQLQLSKNKDWN